LLAGAGAGAGAGVNERRHEHFLISVEKKKIFLIRKSKFF